MQNSGIFTKIKTAIINGGLDSAQLLLFLFYISWLFLSTTIVCGVKNIPQMRDVSLCWCNQD